MNVSWWMWTWCLVLVNLLVSQLTTSGLIGLIVGAIELVVTGLVVAKDTPQKWRGSNLLVIFLSLLAATIFLLPFGGLGATIPLINSITLPENLLRVLYLKRILIVPWLIIAYLAVIWLWSHYLHPKLRDHFANDRLHEFPLKFALFTALLVVVGLVIGNRGSDRWLALVYLIVGSLLIAFWLAWLVERLTALPLHQLPRSLSVALVIIGLVLTGAVYTQAGRQVREASHYPRPIVVSHRGVDHHNGVQNTTQALRRTAREHPEKVETDTQESRDHHFVMMHDPSLKHLAGQNYQVSQRSFHQLKQTTIAEHGHRTKISSLNSYLAVANMKQIPLIIEIKPQNISPQAVAARFISAYRPTQQKNKFMMHSIDPQIIRKVHQLDPQIKTGLIEPFTISKPASDKLTFYSLNYHFINNAQVAALHQKGVKVYAWTVNSPNAALRMKQLKINGIITDNYRDIRDIIAKNDYPQTSRIKNLLFQLI